jgi:hypothetical protein
MNRLPRLKEGYYTQVATDLPIEERVFAKEVAGVMATKEYFRLATQDEIAQWEEFKRKQEEEHQAMMGYENSNA